MEHWQRTAFALLMGCAALACNRTGDANETSARLEMERPCEDWIAGSQARRIVEEGGVLLDVRSSQEFETGHLPNARNINVDDLEEHMSELPRDRHIVVYCQSGRRAHKAAQLLESEGYQVSEIGTQAQYAPDASAGCPD